MRSSFRLAQRPNCTKCNCYLLSSFTSVNFRQKRCENCNEPLRIFTCPGTACKFSKEVCSSCSANFGMSEKDVKPRQAGFSERRRQITNNKNCFYRWFFLLLPFIVFIVAYCKSSSSDVTNQDVREREITRLKSYYASQKNETWYHLQSVLEKEIPTVKSITFLHGEDKKTLNCLINELVSLYTTNSKIKIEEITFSLGGSEARDYGFFLERYHALVEKFRVLVVADLSKVPGSIAKMFHSLCDEESSDIKPSLFIFALKHDKKTAGLKPLVRATTILKEAWGDLPQNEIFPLLSRIIKNVVEVMPEEKVYC